MLTVKPIDKKLAHPFILQIHYAKRLPPISYAFGLYEDEELIGIVTYGQPASPYLCMGLMGAEHKKKVIELNRLCLKYNRKNEASFLVANSIKQLPKPMAIVSYADTAQEHVGIVYQACNFLFTGTTPSRTDIASADGKHSRHHLGDRSNRVFRSSKHRYVFFHGTKIDKKNMLNLLKYPVMEYPKCS